MSVRKLLPIVVLLAAVSIRCSGSPAEPEGMVIVTQTTSTTTSTSTSTTSTTTSVIPTLIAGGVGASPSGLGLASATVFSFVATPPSGGVPPYTFAWNFGDGGEGSGSVASHVYPNTGTFTAVAIATDSRGTTAQASATVGVRNVNGQWTVTFPPATGLMPEPIDLIQTLSAVTATINDTANALGFASGTGNVSNPRSMALSATFRAGTPAAFGVTYIGRLDDTIGTWTGTVTGYAGCPCTFTATRPSTPGDTFRPVGFSSRPARR